MGAVASLVVEHNPTQKLCALYEWVCRKHIDNFVGVLARTYYHNVGGARA